MVIVQEFVFQGALRCCVLTMGDSVAMFFFFFANVHCVCQLNQKIIDMGQV